VFNWLARKIAIKLFLKKIAMWIGGLPAFIVSTIADKLAKRLITLLNYFLNTINDEIKNREARKIDEKNQAKYEEVLKSKNKTKEDIKNATIDFLNGSK